MVIQDLILLAIAVLAFALLFALVNGTELLREGAGDE